MLHLVTPLYRYELLEQVYRSLPPHDDIVWHIAKTSRRPPLTHAFLAADPRVRVYALDCDDADIVAKRNAMFDQVTDGYFYLLDDDTICVAEMYRVYREYQARNFVGMIVGASNINPARMPSVDPAQSAIDTGAVICHHSVLAHVRWAWSPEHSRDWLFWSRCFAHFGPAGTVVLPRTIAAYNHLGPIFRVRKQVLTFPVRWDIRNAFVARCYSRAAGARRRVRRWTTTHL